MKKFVIVLFLLFSSVLLAYSVSAAATAKKARPAQRWHCLQTSYCSKGGCATGPGVVPGHRAKLTTKAGDLPTRNAQTTPFVCITTQEGSICTSGDDDWDLATIGYRGLSKLKQLTGYQFQGLFSKGGTVSVSPRDIYANSQGKLSIITKKQAGGFQLISEVFAAASPANKYQIVEPLEMQDYTPVSLYRKWVALNLVEPVEIEKGQGGQQQGTFTFEGALARCASIAWDPYGIVFDSQSLEPVTGVKVSLLKKRNNGKFTLADGEDTVSILNPITTAEDGQFELYVPDGIYKLDVSVPNFTFPNVAALNPNYAQIYSDIYHGEEIIEKGETQHRDIPIDSKGKPYHSAIKLLGYSPMLDKQTNSIVMEGRVSHPLTKINIYGKKPSGKDFVRTKLLTTVISDKRGQFKIDYNLNKLAITEIIGDIEFIKPDYTNLRDELFIAATKKNSILSIEPILNYLEGYAYDQNGETLTDATVGIYLNFSDKSAYETATDKNGFYRISSEYLPEMAYGIRYTSSDGRIIQVKTSEFISQNAKYLETQQANLFTFKNNKGEIFTETEREKLSNALPDNIQGDNQAAGNNETQKQMIKSNTQSMLLLIIFVLAVLGVGGLGVIVYFIKKRSP